MDGVLVNTDVELPSCSLESERLPPEDKLLEHPGSIHVEIVDLLLQVGLLAQHPVHVLSEEVLG